MSYEFLKQLPQVSSEYLNIYNKIWFGKKVPNLWK